MKFKYHIVSIILAFLLNLIGNAFSAEKGSGKNNTGDWPQYRGQNSDGISQETGLLKSWPEGGPEEVWRVPIGVGYSPIAVVDGRVYTMDSKGESEFLICVDAANGNEFWRKNIGPTFKSSYGDGPRSCPTIDEEIIYALNATGNLIAADRLTGKAIWSLDIKQKFVYREPQYWHGFGSSPFIEKDLLLLNVGGEGNKSIAALNKKTGEMMWTAHSDFAAYSTPIAVDFNGDRQFVFVTAQAVVSISLSGDINWTYPWGGNIIKVAMPVFVPPDKIFVSASYGIGAVLLKMKPENNSILVEEVWKSQIMSTHFNTAIRIGKYLYGFDNGTFKCIETETEKQMWVKRRLGKGSLTYADGHFYVLSERGKLLLVEANPNEYIEKGSVQILNGRTWTPPTLAGGRLFLRNQKEMVCLNLRK